MRCDFCHVVCEEADLWTFECKPFSIELSTGRLVYFDDGAWGACESCVPDVKRRRWGKVLERFRKINPVDTDIDLTENDATLWRLWRAFNENRTGEPFKERVDAH